MITIMMEMEHETLNKEQGSPNLGPCSLLHLVVASSQGDFIGTVAPQCQHPTLAHCHLKGRRFSSTPHWTVGQ